MLRLTDEQRAALAAAGGAGVEIEDDRTRRRYVLLPADAFAKARADAGPGGDLDPADALPLVAEALAGVWDDPALDIYNDYDAAPRP